MKKNEILIMLCLVIFLILLSHYFKREVVKNEDLNPISLDKESNNYSGRSFSERLIFTFLTPKKKTKDSSQSHSDSDLSQCGTPPALDQKVTTLFAGYTLEYPCLASGSGSVKTRYDENDEMYKIYTLRIGVLLGGGKNHIWREGVKQKYSGTQGFTVKLLSRRYPGTMPPLIKQKNETALAVEESINDSLTLYRNERTVYGILKNHKDVSGYRPIIACNIGKDIELELVFGNFYGLKDLYSGNCSMAWMFTEDIYLNIRSVNLKYAAGFEQIYEAINTGLQEIIISRPELVSTI